MEMLGQAQHLLVGFSMRIAEAIRDVVGILDLHQRRVVKIVDGTAFNMIRVVITLLRFD